MIYARAAEGHSEALLAAKKKAESVSAAVFREENAPERHFSVVLTIARLRKRKSDPRRLVTVSAPDCFKVTAGPASIERVERFLARLVRAVEAAAWKIRPSETGLCVLAEGETVTIAISETMEETRHAPTREDMLKLARWERKRKRDQQAGIFRPISDRPSFPTSDYAPNGQLQVRLEAVYGIRGPSPRRTFADGKTQTIESLFGEIVVGIALAAAGKREHREFYEEQRREREEREQRRLQAERREALLEQRISALDQLLEAHERIAKVERFLDRLDRGSEDRPEALTPFLVWARSHVADLEAALAPARLAEALAQTGLFPKE